jgi:hypothetical protein
MTVRIADLDKDRPDIFVDQEVWGRVVDILRAKHLLEEETLGRLASPCDIVTVSVEQARRIGSQVLDIVLQGMRRGPDRPPKPPSYVIPIATSNGVWIDPALGPLQQWLKDQKAAITQLLVFGMFCENCQGFSVGQ